MKVLLILFTTMATFNCAAQMIQLRPSLGNGKPFSVNHRIAESKIGYNLVTFDKYYGGKFDNRVLQLPQAGLMLEYKVNPQHTIGLGIMAGRTELNYITNAAEGAYLSARSSAATIKKIGVEYTYTKDIGNFKISPVVGAFLISHDYNNYGCCPIIFTNQDNAGYTIDSSTSTELKITQNGLMASLGLRLAMNNKSGKESVSVTFLYDHGFTNLWQATSFYYYNYLQDYTNASSSARGSQFKVYLSMPIRIYNTQTKKFSWQLSDKE